MLSEVDIQRSLGFAVGRGRGGEVMDNIAQRLTENSG